MRPNDAHPRASGFRDSHHSQAWIVWSQFRRHKLAIAGSAFLMVMIVIAVLGRWIEPYDPIALTVGATFGRPQPPSALHLLGTDPLGRDVLSRLISGAQISLSVGFVAVGISIAIGIIFGTAAGYVGGSVDNVIMRLADVFLSIPSFFLILTVNAYLKPSIFNVMAVIGIFNWMAVARLVRGEFLRLKQLDFTVAARAVGVPGGRLAVRHLLPNALAPVIVAATLAIPGAILTESALSFLGLGVPQPQASWGNILFDSKDWINVAWWMWVSAGLLISLTVIAFNFAGDGLRDAFDPLQRR